MMSKSALYRFVGTTCLVVYGWVGFNLVRLFIKGSSAPDVCLLKSTTGVPCPFCGTTRSVMSVLQGEWMNALHLNPLGILLMVFVMIVPLWMLVDYILKRETFYQTFTKVKLLLRPKWWLAILVIIIVGLWFLNIVRGV
jgi:hypothetical protein